MSSRKTIPFKKKIMFSPDITNQSIKLLKIQQYDNKYMLNKITEILNTFLLEKQQYQDKLFQQKQQLITYYQAIIQQNNTNILELQNIIHNLQNTIISNKQTIQKTHNIIQQKQAQIQSLKRYIKNNTLFVHQINVNTKDKWEKSKILQDFTPLVSIKSIDSINKDGSQLLKMRKRLQQIVVNTNSNRPHHFNYTTERKSANYVEKNIKVKAFDLNLKGKENLKKNEHQASQSKLSRRQSKVSSKQKGNSLRKSLPSNTLQSKDKFTSINNNGHYSESSNKNSAKFLKRFHHF